MPIYSSFLTSNCSKYGLLCRLMSHLLFANIFGDRNLAWILKICSPYSLMITEFGYSLPGLVSICGQLSAAALSLRTIGMVVTFFCVATWILMLICLSFAAPEKWTVQVVWCWMYGWTCSRLLIYKLLTASRLSRLQVLGILCTSWHILETCARRTGVSNCFRAWLSVTLFIICACVDVLGNLISNLRTLFV